MESQFLRQRATKRCAEWLVTCLNLGWSQLDLDKLEAIWWANHDDLGRLWGEPETIANKVRANVIANESQRWYYKWQDERTTAENYRLKLAKCRRALGELRRQSGYQQAGQTLPRP